MFRPPLAIALSLLTGLATATDREPDAPHYPSPAGWILTLRRELTVPPEAATVRLQYGRVVASNAVQEHDPHCIFELDTVRATPQTVRPQSMRVVGTRRGVSTFSGMPVWPYPPFWSGPVGWSDDAGPSHLYYRTEFRLQSETQPEVRSLTCQSNQMAPGIAIMRHLTLREIRQAVGDYFSLEPPADHWRSHPPRVKGVEVLPGRAQLGCASPHAIAHLRCAHGEGAFRRSMTWAVRSSWLSTYSIPFSPLRKIRP